MTLLDALRRSPLYHPIRPVTQRIELLLWSLSGRPVPVPHRLKQKLVASYQERFAREILVETGTYLGTMAIVMRRRFRRVFSIEVDPALFALATRRLARFENVELRHGDSEVVLPSVLSALDGPTLFWLDAHLSGPLTGRGRLETPIRDEVRVILTALAEPVLLIDDAHLFRGRNDYPTLEELFDLVRSLRPGLEIEVRDDVVRIHP